MVLILTDANNCTSQARNNVYKIIYKYKINYTENSRTISELLSNLLIRKI